MNLLPPLPKQNKQKEANFGVRLRRWVESMPDLTTGSLEIKHTRGKPSFPFREFKPEQQAFAHMIEFGEKGCLIRVQGTNGEPDYIFMKKEPAYVVIRYPDYFYAIRVKDFIEEKKTSTRKSLVESRAAAIAVYRG